jgi:hypothetical protein
VAASAGPGLTRTRVLFNTDGRKGSCAGLAGAWVVPHGPRLAALSLSAPWGGDHSDFRVPAPGGTLVSIASVASRACHWGWAQACQHATQTESPDSGSGRLGPPGSGRAGANLKFKPKC